MREMNMKHNFARGSALMGILAAVALAAFATGCAAPSPLYGTWSDNQGNKISFVDELSYTATVVDSSGTSVSYSGSYSVLLNTLVFNKNSGGTVVTEWDIRGNIMYLNWVDADNETKALSLYKTSN